MPTKPANITIIIFTCLAFLFVNFSPNANFYNLLFGLNVNFFNGAYWQILSSIFMHANFEHLAMNMLALYAFGWRIENFLGALKFLLLYILGGVITSILSLIFLYFNTNANIIGASGAVCVLLGFMAYFMPQIKQGLFIGVLVMSFAPLLFGINIAWFAHIIGFFVGFVFGYLKDRFNGRF